MILILICIGVFWQDCCVKSSSQRSFPLQIHVIDSSSSNALSQRRTVQDVLTSLGMAPEEQRWKVLEVWNKVDALMKNHPPAMSLPHIKPRLQHQKLLEASSDTGTCEALNKGSARATGSMEQHMPHSTKGAAEHSSWCSQHELNGLVCKWLQSQRRQRAESLQNCSKMSEMHRPDEEDLNDRTFCFEGGDASRQRQQQGDVGNEAPLIATTKFPKDRPRMGLPDAESGAASQRQAELEGAEAPDRSESDKMVDELEDERGAKPRKLRSAELRRSAHQTEAEEDFEGCHHEVAYASECADSSIYKMSPHQSGGRQTAKQELLGLQDTELREGTLHERQKEHRCTVDLGSVQGLEGGANRQDPPSQDGHNEELKQLLSAGVAVSATKGWGVSELRRRLEDFFEKLPSKESGQSRVTRPSKLRKPRRNVVASAA
jgi:hypothetical protein